MTWPSDLSDEQIPERLTRSQDGAVKKFTSPRDPRTLSPMVPHRSRAVQLLVAAAIGWHLLALLLTWSDQQRSPHGHDFASFYYANRVAGQGDNPYELQNLLVAVAEDGAPRAVHPYLYPPPFLITLAWTDALSLEAAYHVWFWCDELLLLLTLAVLIRWWTRPESELRFLLILAAACMAAAVLNHVKGQMNMLVMATAFGGLWAQRSGRDGLGGTLLATACVFKMSPALFVLWWMVERR